MFWFGLAATISVPGYLGTSIPAGWATMSMALPLALWRKASMTPLHWAGVAFLAYAVLSLLWAPDRLDGGWALWQLVILALAFWLGSTGDLRLVWIGLATGLSVSSLIAVVQWFGYNPVVTMSPAVTPGLYFNPIAAGEATALIMIALWNRRMFGFIPLLLPGLILSHSRGAWLALLFGTIAVEFRSLVFLLALCTFLVPPILFLQNPDDLIRLDIWRSALIYMTLLGNGAGSFLSLFCCIPPPNLLHPEYAHNDFLQLAFEFGIGSAPLAFAFAWCSLCRSSDEWPVLVTFLFMGAFSFPFHIPIVAFAGALAAGSIARDWGRVRDRGLVRRPTFVGRVEPARSLVAPNWS